MRLLKRSRWYRAGALVLLAACGADDEARLTVSAQPMPAPLSTAEVRYRIVAGSKTWTATIPVPSDGVRSEREFDTPTSGEARVAFTMVLPGGREISAGEVTIALRGDWGWSFDLFAATENPERTCFGCFGSVAFPLDADLRRAGRDSLWLVWGGNSIKHPVVY